MSHSSIAEPVIENSDVAFGAELTPRLTLCTSTGAPIEPLVDGLAQLT